MHYLFYVTKYIHVIHTLASHLQNKQGNWGQSGVDVSQPAGYAVCDGNMSSYLVSFLMNVYVSLTIPTCLMNVNKLLFKNYFVAIQDSCVRAYLSCASAERDIHDNNI